MKRILLASVAVAALLLVTQIDIFKSKAASAMTFPFPSLTSSSVNYGLFFVANTSDTSNATVYTFTSASIGPSRADRTVYVLASVSLASGSNGPSSCTIGGNAATKVAEKFSGVYSTTLFRLLVTSGTTANIVVTNATGTQVRCQISVYYSLDLSAVILDYETSAATAASATIADVAIRPNGFLVGGGASGNTGAASGSWGGGDALTEDLDAALEAAIRVFAYRIQKTTENSDTNDVSLTFGGSAAYDSLMASFGTKTYARLEFGKSFGAGSGTSYTISPGIIGGSSSGRMVAVCISWSSTSARTVSSATVNGTTLISAIAKNSSLAGVNIMYATGVTGDSAEVAITFSGATTGVQVAVYRLDVASSTPVDAVASSGTSSTQTVTDLEVKNGGSFVAVDITAAASVTPSYNGTDALVNDFSIVRNSFLSTYVSGLTTENNTTRDITFTISGSSANIACGASWL